MKIKTSFITGAILGAIGTTALLNKNTTKKLMQKFKK